jgi:hypothetical protein
MTYAVITFIGDFPVEGQPSWTKEYDTVQEAIDNARLQHATLSIDKDQCYTTVLDLNKGDEEDVMWIIYHGEEKEGLKAQEIADDLGSRI